MEGLLEPVEAGAVICLTSSNVPVMRSLKGKMEAWGYIVMMRQL